MLLDRDSNQFSTWEIFPLGTHRSFISNKTTFLSQVHNIQHRFLNWTQRRLHASEKSVRFAYFSFKYFFFLETGLSFWNHLLTSLECRTSLILMLNPESYNTNQNQAFQLCFYTKRHTPRRIEYIKKQHNSPLLLLASICEVDTLWVASMWILDVAWLRQVVASDC